MLLHSVGSFLVLSVTLVRVAQFGVPAYWHLFAGERGMGGSRRSWRSTLGHFCIAIASTLAGCTGLVDSCWV